MKTKRSSEFGTAMGRSADRRKCPKCGRKSAIKRLSLAEDDFVAAYCRWDDCDYVRLRVPNQEHSPAKRPT